MGVRNTLRATRKSIKRNKFLSFSTVFVITIVFLISSLFIISSLIAREAVAFYETKAQVIVFFDQETPEEEILDFRDEIDEHDYIEDIEYISQEDAFELYKEDFQDDKELIETITANVLPPSLNIRAKSAEDLTKVIEDISEEKKENPYIDEVLFFEDVIEIMKSASAAVTYAAMVIIPILLLIAFTVVSITVGFNVTLHQKEIEIMHVIGGEDSYIKWPFKIEGMIYGALGGLLSALIILVPWFVFLHYNQDTDFYTLIQQTLRDFNLDFVTYPNAPFILSFLGIHIGFGLVVGYIASTISLIKNLNLKKK